MDNPFRNSNNRFRSQNGTGSMVELPSNMSVLAPIQLEKHYAQIHAGELPPEIASEILHEFTHHWCFNSPVGSTLTGLYFRIVRRAATESRSEPLLEDIIRFETTLSFLRPLSEGLALFGEFDVRPGSYNTRATVFGWLIFLFHAAMESEDAVSSYNSPFERLLQKMRAGGGNCIAKESLLCSPLSVHQGGYLAGYLAVKALWHKVRHDVPDAELFWTFLRFYFFEDHAFLEVMLKPNEIDRIQPDIFVYFSERLALLSSMDLSDALVEFDADLSRRTLEQPDAKPHELASEGLPMGLGLDAKLAATGIHRANALLSEVRDLQSGQDPFLESIAGITSNTFSRRHLLCLGAVSGRVTVKDRMVEFHSESGFCHCIEAVPGAEDREGSGSFEVYYSTVGLYCFEVVTIDTRVVSLKLEADAVVKDYEKSNLLITTFNRESILALNKTVEAHIEAFVQEQGFARFLNITREQRDDWVNKIYVDHYLNSANCYDSEQRRLLEEMMFEDGFWLILGDELELVRGVSILGVGQAVGWSEAKIDEHLGKEGVNRGELIRRVKEIETRLGLRIFEGDEVTLRV